MEVKDYYKILEINKTATPDEIKKAYRKQAMQWHPDRNPGDKAAEAKFKEISEANEILSNPEKRKAYDNPQPKHSFRNFNWDANFGNGFGNFRTDGKPFDNVVREQYNPQLDINLDINAHFGTMFGADSLEHTRNYIRVGGSFNNRTSESAEIKIKINLSTLAESIFYDQSKNKYFIQKTYVKLGNSVSQTVNLTFGTVDLNNYGNLNVRIWIDMPTDVYIADGIIHHRMAITLHDLLFGEKIQLKTITGRKFDVKIKTPKSLSDVQVIIPKVGLLDQYGNPGNYMFHFDIKPLDPEKLSTDESKVFKDILSRI